MRSEGEDGVGDRNVGAGLAAPVQCSIDSVTGEKRGKRAKREESVQGTVAAMPFTAYTCFTRIHMTTGGGGGACLRGHAKEHTTVHGNVHSAHRRNAVASFRHASCARRRVCGSSITLRGVFAVLPYRGVARGLDESHKAMTPNGRMNLFIFASESTQWLWRCDLRAQRRSGHASAPERHPPSLPLLWVLTPAAAIGDPHKTRKGHLWSLRLQRIGIRAKACDEMCLLTPCRQRSLRIEGRVQVVSRALRVCERVEKKKDHSCETEHGQETDIGTILVIRSFRSHTHTHTYIYIYIFRGICDRG